MRKLSLVGMNWRNLAARRGMILLTVVAMLVGSALAGEAAKDKLVERLEADYQKYLAEEKNPQSVREAAQALEETDQSSQWTRFMDALRLIRQTRSKAAIPLLLKYTIRHAEFGGNQTASYADTLTILTGKKFAIPESGPDRQKAAREYVEKIVTEWWTPGKAKISTSLSKMSRDELTEVTAKLLENAAKYETDESTLREREVTAYRLYQLLHYRIMATNASDRRTWNKEDLDPAMTPLFLEMVGYREQPPEKPERTYNIPYAAVKMLATLRKNGDAPALDAIAEDARQCSAARLTCVLALCVAGERLKTPVLVDVLEKEKDLELRMVAILALKDSPEKRLAGEKLVPLLDDRNSEIRTAAIRAVQGPLPPNALPKLKKAVDDLDPPQAMSCIFEVIGEYKNREACEILAGYLGAALEDRDKAKHIDHALRSFGKASGKDFVKKASSRDDAIFRDKAREAIQWWREEGRRTFNEESD